MTGQVDDLQQTKVAVSILATCLVETLNDSDPTFKDRFLKTLTEAYYKARDNSDGDQRHTFELLSWTREHLTGFSLFTGQGEPHLDRPK